MTAPELAGAASDQTATGNASGDGIGSGSEIASSEGVVARAEIAAGDGIIGGGEIATGDAITGTDEIAAGDAGDGVAAAAGHAPAGFADPDARWLRLSRRSLVVRPLTDLARLLPLVAGLVLLHARTGGGLVWGIAAAAFAVVTGVVHWATTRYLITDERVYLRHGLLNQKRLSVARDRIRTVDVTAHLLHRVLGVCRLSIGTGRNDFRSGENIHLDGLTRADADALRALLLAGPVVLGAGVGTGPGNLTAAEPAARPPGQEGDPGREIARLRLSWLRFAPLTTTGLVVLGVLFGSVVQLTNATDRNLAATGPVKALVAGYTALSVVQRVLVGSSVATAGYVVLAMAGYIAAFWNFRLAGYGDDTLRVTRGLLSVRATTISMTRLRGIEISEPLLLRAARGARCIAITTGLLVGRGSEHEGSVLLPPAPRKVALAVTAAVLGIPPDLCSGPLQAHGSAARRRRYVRALVGALIIIAGVCAATWVQHGPAWVWIGSFVLLPASAAIAADRYRSLGHRLTDGWLVTRLGSLARRRSIIGTDAIIGWRIHQTWFQRRQGLITLTATTAAGQQHYSVRDVPVAQGLAIAATATGDLIRPFLAAAGTEDPGSAGPGSASPGSAGPGAAGPTATGPNATTPGAASPDAAG